MQKIFSIVFFIYMSLFFSYSQNNVNNDINSIYIYNFIKNTKWNNNFDTLKVNVYNDKNYTLLLKKYFYNKYYKNKPIIVNNIETLKLVKNSQVLILTDKNAEELVTLKNTKNMLVITQYKNMLKFGSCINLYTENDKLKFEISMSNITNNYLQISYILEKLSK